MGLKTIKLTFDRKTGKVIKDVQGFTSSECVSKTQFIDTAIGKVEKTEFKPEYHLPNTEGLDVQAKLFN